MGQNVTVVQKSSSNPELLRFEINRSLTGMGHERYDSLDDIVDDRVVDVLARRLFEAGGVESIHVNSSVITVRLGGGSTGEGLLDVIRNMFRFYGDEVPDAEAMPDAPPPDDSEELDAAAAPESAVDHDAAAEASRADAADAPGETTTSSAME